MIRAVSDVFRHEWSGFLRGGEFRVIFAVVGIIGVAMVLGEYGAWRSENRDRLALQRAEIEQWLSLDDAHIHKAAHRGYFVVRELPSGSILDRGVWDFGGSVVWLEAHRRNATQLRAADTAAVLARGVPRGVGSLLLWLVPLLLAVLLHPVVVAERVSGSLAFAVSSGASPGAIVLGKTLASVTLTWAAAALPLLVGAGLAIGAGFPVVAAVSWAAYVLTGLSIFAAVVVVVSSLTRQSLGALVSLLLIWFVMAVLLPRITPGLVQEITPVPSSQTVRSEAEVAAEGLVSDATRDAVFQGFRDSGVAEPNESGVSAMAAEIDAAAEFARIFAPLEDGMQRQADALDFLSWASPLAAADRASDTVVGLGDRDHLAFEARAEEMRFATQMALNAGWARAGASDRGDPTLWRNVVSAAEAIPHRSAVDGHAGWGLVVWTLFSACGLFAAARAVRGSV